MHNLSQKNLLITTQTLHMIVESVSSIIITLFLYQTASLTTVIQFRLLELLIIPAALLTVGFIIDTISPKISLFIGLLLLVVQLLYVLIIPSTMNGYLLILALFAGSSAVFRTLSLRAIVMNSISVETQTTFFAQITIISRVISVLFPLFSGLIIATLGYTPIFISAIFATAITVASSFLIKTNLTHNRYQPFKPLRHLTKKMRTLAGIHVLWGAEFGILTIAVPILITHILQSELAWGVFTAFLSLISIAYAYYFKKHANTLAAIGIFGFLLACIALLYASNGNIFQFILFMIVLQFWQVTQQVGLMPAINNSIEEEIESSDDSTEYATFFEYPFLFGRFSGLVVLFGFGAAITQPVYIGIFFALLSLIPIYEAVMIGVLKIRPKNPQK